MGDSRNVINARRHINIRDAAINCGLPIFHINYMYLTTDVCTESMPFDSQPLRPRTVIQQFQMYRVRMKGHQKMVNRHIETIYNQIQ